MIRRNRNDLTIMWKFLGKKNERKKIEKLSELLGNIGIGKKSYRHWLKYRDHPRRRSLPTIAINERINQERRRRRFALLSEWHTSLPVNVPKQTWEYMTHIQKMEVWCTLECAHEKLDKSKRNYENFFVRRRYLWNVWMLAFCGRYGTDIVLLNSFFPSDWVKVGTE